MATISARPNTFAYLAYGYGSPRLDSPILLGFTGEHPDVLSGLYLLGNGYRPYSPVLMRFTCPDSWSPFGLGGLHAYAYCGCDPVNRKDPSGHTWAGVSFLFRLSKVRRSSGARTPRESVQLDQADRMSPVGSLDGALNYIGRHGSTNINAVGLLQGLNAKYQNSAGGLSSGKGFYVALTDSTAKDFAGMAADYARQAEPGGNVQPEVYSVFAYNFNAKVPGKDYRFGTMGEGGLVPRKLEEMELLLYEPMYEQVVIRRGQPNQRQMLPRASEAPF
ncbi:RHS repeat-associated core domain-containing protein [Pseudomonas sp. SID14000]|uniref:RHS repeat-associated core domain-containing protein n=1 Tax=Pseudomonas sp. SID14000 TaxID=1986221 RepID=UPI0021157F3E|nr:RHS repeat-associated core domain-containing protein [Pseudomonas sp. SID14000]